MKPLRSVSSFGEVNVAFWHQVQLQRMAKGSCRKELGRLTVYLICSQWQEPVNIWVGLMFTEQLCLMDVWLRYFDEDLVARRLATISLYDGWLCWTVAVVACHLSVRRPRRVLTNTA